MSENHIHDDATATTGRRTLDRNQLLDFAAQRGARITASEAAMPMPDLHKIVLDRLSALHELLESATPQGGFIQ